MIRNTLVVIIGLPILLLGLTYIVILGIIAEGIYSAASMVAEALIEEVD